MTGIQKENIIYGLYNNEVERLIGEKNKEKLEKEITEIAYLEVNAVRTSFVWLHDY